jgi:hypothetical protein
VRDILTLFAAGVALSALLVASYSRRGTWVACCSTAMSVAVLIGWAFLSTIEDPSQVRAGFIWLAGQLPLVLDQRTLDELTMAIEQGSTSSLCGVKAHPACVASSRAGSPIPHDDDIPRSAGSSSEVRQAMQAASTTSWFEDSKEASRSSVIWLLDGPDVSVSSGIASRYLISGMNVSDKTLTGVHGTLKPDSSQHELELALNVQGHKLEDGSIPAGARFSLGFDFPKTSSPKQFGGAIFTFRYMYAGRQKATIQYLTPSMIVRFANRG